MTVGTQQPQVGDPVVRAIAVDVVEFQRDRLTTPGYATAALAAMVQYPLLEKPHAKLVRLE